MKAEAVAYLMAAAFIAGVGVTVVLGRPAAEDAYRQFITGQATVITYTVPGQGECRAVLVDGQRHAETCEGGEK